MAPATTPQQLPATPGAPHKKHKGVSFAKADVVKQEHTPLIVFGVAKIRRTKLMATLSGLKLEGEITGLQTSVQYKEKIRAPTKAVVEASVVGNMQETKIVLLEGVQPNQQTVVKVTIGQTTVIHTSHMWKTRDKNSGTMSVKLVHIDIPQHPVDLHTMVTRGTKELYSTLQELRNVRMHRGKSFMPAAAMDETDGGSASGMGMYHQSPKLSKRECETPTPQKMKSPQLNPEDSTLIKPLVMQFHLTLHKLAVSAALLPSLSAEYSMVNVTSRGVTGSSAHFVVDVPKHTLSFSTNLKEEQFTSSQDNYPAPLTGSMGNIAGGGVGGSGGTVPPGASIELPGVHVTAEYVLQDETGVRGTSSTVSEDGAVISHGNYLSAEAEIGKMEHCFTSEALNHLVFVQKVFMREVNDVVQKLSGGERLVPVWNEFGEDFEIMQTSSSSKRLLFSISVRLKAIRITALTPTMAGVRDSGVKFETGKSELQISNRVENVQGSTVGGYKISTSAQVNLKLSLVQVIPHPIYKEAENQFIEQAYFKTSIKLRNAFQGETAAESSLLEKDMINITLKRPLVFVQVWSSTQFFLFGFCKISFMRRRPLIGENILLCRSTLCSSLFSDKVLLVIFSTNVFP